MSDILIALQEYCNMNLLTLNTEKTKIVIFKKGSRNYKNLKFDFGGKRLKWYHLTYIWELLLTLV